MKRIIELVWAHRIIAMTLAIVMIVSAIPFVVLAATPAELTTDIGEKHFVVGVETDFTYTTIANDDEDTMVLASLVFSDPSAIEKLQYKDAVDGNWYFAPSSGFPLKDAVSEFRVTFKKAGIYTVSASIKAVDDNSVLCFVDTTIKVDGKSSVSTDISDKLFVVGETAEFELTTMANEDAGTLVNGSLVFSDSEAVEKMEYLDSADNEWHLFEKDFGGDAGFCLTDDATIRFRITFKKPGALLMNVYINRADTGDTLCCNFAEVTVKARSAISFENDSIEIRYSDANAFNDSLIDSVADAKYTYSSDNENVAKVNKYGILTPVSLGSATITVTREENEYYLSSSASYTVHVTKGLQNALVWENTIPDAIKWNDPDGFKNAASGGTGDGKITYESSDTNVAEVDKDGKLTLKKPGIVTVTATKFGGELFDNQSASYTLVVIKAEQNALVFDDLYPDAICSGEKYTNTATGGSTGGKIVYSSSNPTVATVDEYTGTVFSHQMGVVTITATLAGDDYYEDAIPVSYTLNILQSVSLSFEKGTLGQTIRYGDEYVNRVTCEDEDIKEVPNVTYSSSDKTVATVNASTGEVIALKAGKVTITAHVQGLEGYYAETELSYELEITRAEQTVVFEKSTSNIPAITYGETYQNMASATTEISYSTSDETVAAVDAENGSLTVYKAGTVTVTATAAETEQYASASASYTITVNKAFQLITFEQGNTVTVTFNDNDNQFTNPAITDASGGSEDFETLYEIIYGEERVNNFDSSNGSFTIVKAGEIRVKVYFFENDRYLENTASYTLSVEKDVQKIAFENETYEMINGDKSFKAPVANEQGEHYGDGAIKYAVLSDENGVIEKINSETGELTFTNKTGSITVQAIKSACENYESAEATYRLTVVNAETNGEELYLLNGAHENDSGWYTGNVSVVACDGYELSYFAEAQSSNWCETLSDAVTEDGKHTVTFYVRNKESGYIYEAQSVTVFKDTVCPTVQLFIEDSMWYELLEVLTFDLWKNTSVHITAEYSDAMSDIDEILYYTATGSSQALSFEELQGLYEAGNFADFKPFDIEKDEMFALYLRVTDRAGNISYVCSNGYIVDKTAADISFETDTPVAMHNGVPVFNKDVSVDIYVSEQNENAYSGIKKVKYWLTCDKVVTLENTIEFGTENASASAERVYSYHEKVVIDSEKNNSCNVILNVEVTDNAGNVIPKTLPLDFDLGIPVMEVSYDNNSPYKAKATDSKGYFPADRTATIIVTERSGHFDEVAALTGIRVKATNVAGKPIYVGEKQVTVDEKGYVTDLSQLFGTLKWKTVEGNTPDAAKHILVLPFSYDANYEIELSYTDLACNSISGVSDGSAVTPYSFAIDKTDPTGSITAGELGTWDKLIEVLTFGLWSKDTVDIVGTVDDATTGVESVSYYKTSDIKEKTESDLDKVTEWVPFSGITVPADEQFVVYLKIVDKAGNVAYISTNGIIVDDTVPAIESVKPEITITPEPVNGIYNDDVTIAVSVIDPKAGDTQAYAGLKEIRYEVYNRGVLTQEDVLYSFITLDPLHRELQQSWSKADAIVVDKNKNNSNDVKIVVYAVDNAGNINQAECSIMIDTTAPQIRVTYDNNDGDTAFAESVYFNKDRVAKIVVKERNFDPDLVKIQMTNTDGYVPTLSAWTTEKATGNGDETTHTAYITFDRDGDYTFEISCTDTATNANTAVDFADTLAPQKFTVDKTAPLVEIVYDNNEVLNGNYFKAQRIATITITEHNFETSRIKISLQATDDGAETVLPVVSEWLSDGDVHTATITYAEDALYVFDFDYSDKAGNAISDIEEQSFYVDQTAPVLSIEQIVDESANNDEGKIGFVMTATDTNFDLFTPVLTAVIRNGNSFETKQLEIGEISDIKNGKVFTVDNIETDGIYRITCSLVDKAGNAYTEVILEKADGSKYAEQRANGDTLLTFSVNRDGSTFELDQNTSAVLEQYYIRELENDIVIIEINVDPLKEFTVTLNGVELVKDTDYTVTEEGGNGNWMKYTYKVSKKLFASEGEYTLVVSSKDKADNDAFSDVKGATVKFVVDRTAPVVTVSGLATNGRYQTEEQTVTLIPTDDGGKLNTLVVNLIDDDGNILKELINLSGEALEAELEKNGGEIKFAIQTGWSQNIQIICTDTATDSSGLSNTYNTVFENITVSTNAFLIFWANPVLRWSTIGGVSAVIISLAALLIIKKKKRRNA